MSFLGMQSDLLASSQIFSDLFRSLNFQIWQNTHLRTGDLLSPISFAARNFVQIPFTSQTCTQRQNSRNSHDAVQAGKTPWLSTCVSRAEKNWCWSVIPNASVLSCDVLILFGLSLFGVFWPRVVLKIKNQISNQSQWEGVNFASTCEIPNASVLSCDVLIFFGLSLFGVFWPRVVLKI